MPSDAQVPRDDARDARFDADALALLPEVARYALSLTRDEGDAGDLVQETYLRAFRAWRSFKPGTELRAWLFTICRNAFLATRVRAQREPSYDDPEVEAVSAAAQRDAALQNGLDAMWSADLGDAIRDALARLPEPFREAVELVDVNDCSYEGASEILGVPVGTVRSRLFRGRRLLQAALIDHARDQGLRPARGDDRGGAQ